MKSLRFALLLLLVAIILFQACDKDKEPEEISPRPTVDFSFNPAEPIAGQQISFMGSATNASSYQWSSNPQGFTASALSASHAFSEPGNYQVTLRATGPGGTAEVTKTVTVGSPAPTADFSFTPSNPRVNETVSFSSTVSNATSYQWSSSPAGFSSTAVSPSHAFTQAGDYEITLVATGPGGSVTVSKTLTVTALAPVADFTFSPNAPIRGQEVSFTNLSSNATTYEWSSVPAGFSSTSENPSFTFTESGTYTITLVASGLGGSDEITQQIVVLEPSPTADFSFTPSNPRVNETVSFSSTVSNVTSYQWSSSPAGFNSTAASPSHAFTQAGDYEITLVATGPGGSVTVSKTLTVTALAPVADFTFSPNAPIRGQEVSFTNLSSNATTYEWSSVPAGFSSTSENPSFTFTESGTYAITLVASGLGGSDEITQNVVVRVPSPVAEFEFNPLDPEIGQEVTFTNLSENATSYQWTSEPEAFNSTEKNPTFTFTEPGRYTISLTAMGPGGENSTTKELNVTAPSVNKLVEILASRKLEKNRPTGPTELEIRNGSAQFYTQREDDNTILYLFPGQVTMMGETYSRLQNNVYFFDNLNINGNLRFTNSEIINQVPAFNHDFGIVVPAVPAPSPLPTTNDLLNGVNLDFSNALAGRSPAFSISVMSTSTSAFQTFTLTPNASGIIENFQVQGLDASQGFRLIISDRSTTRIDVDDWILHGTVEAQLTLYTNPPAAAPTASFTYNPTNPEAGKEVTFTNTSTNADTFLWTFTRDGGTGGRVMNNSFTRTDINPVVIFPQQGSWSVRLQASGPGGTVSSEALAIEVSPAQVGGGGNDSTCNLPNCYVSQTITTVSGSTVTTNYTYKTIAGKKVLDKLEIISGGGGFAITTTTVYDYNTLGQEIRSTTSTTIFGNTTISVIVESLYDSIGRLVRENSINAQGVMESYTLYFYGANNRLSEVQNFDGTLGFQDYSIYDQYDSEGNYGRVREFAADGTLTSTATYTWQNCQPKTIIVVDINSGTTVLNQVNEFGSNQLISKSTTTVQNPGSGGATTSVTNYAYVCD